MSQRGEHMLNPHALWVGSGPGDKNELHGGRISYSRKGEIMIIIKIIGTTH